MHVCIPFMCEGYVKVLRWGSPNLRSSGSLLANLNQNNLKYGAEMGRTPSFMQGAMTPLGASPNKNLGPEKVILLVCNRACSGHQGRRYCRSPPHAFIVLS